jgi:hypothetical protein
MTDLAHLDGALREGNVAEARDEMWRLFPHVAAKARLQQMAAFALGAAEPPAAKDAMEQTFFNCIAETKRRLGGAVSPPLQSLSIGPELDSISDRGGVDDWSPAQCLSNLMLGQIVPRRKAAVVTSVRDDGIYLLDWVAHHLVLGFEHIVIYTNDNSDGSEELLRKLALHGVITLIESETAGDEPPEGKAFGHAVQLLHDLRDFEWVLFVDSDEYFVPGPQYNNSVSNVISAVRRKFGNQPPSGICYDWLWFVSGMKFEREPGPLLERFQHARPHHLTKCLARIQDVLSMRRDHYAEVKQGGFIVGSTFEAIDLSTIYRRIPEYAGGQINHYWPRSFEEFAIKKARGATLKMEVNLYDRPYSKFFSWNGYETPENHYPPDSTLLWRVKWQVEELKKLEGVRALSAKLEDGFPYFLRRIVSDAELRGIYKSSQTEPGNL